ncbi:hypothetical protein EV183_003449 [Coemansia sp. RSA 2336]|nr:hypothetical protein EV183_003449 [Coemansia sp. RSA 2336]
MFGPTLLIINYRLLRFVYMGKSAKAVKRPTKKQKELKKSRASADAAIAKGASLRTSGGGVSKPKRAPKTRAGKSKQVDYLALFSK